MIAFVRGRLEEYSEDRVVLDIGGIGYEVFVPTRFIADLPAKGAEIFLYTYHHVKEDDQRLYGFPHKEERTLFELLLTVSGIGPKVALSILSKVTCEEFTFILETGDVKAMSKIPGLGTKTASRIFVELKDRVAKDLGSMSGSFSGEQKAISADRHDAMEALKELGFTVSEIQTALAEVPSDVTGAGHILQEALKRLGR